MRNSKQFIIAIGIACSLITTSPAKVKAQSIAEVISGGVRRVIRAVDLRIQRLQNKTIALQNAQKILENKLSELKLTGIAQWTERHRALYQHYFNELWEVRNIIEHYHQLERLYNKQVSLIHSYSEAWQLIQNDDHFTPKEIAYIHKVYAGILQQTSVNIDEVQLAINSFKLQMADAERLKIISNISVRIDENYADLRQFTRQNIQLSLSRAKSKTEIQNIRKLYGLENE